VLARYLTTHHDTEGRRHFRTFIVRSPLRLRRFHAAVSKTQLTSLRMINALTVDVEEYFHPSEVQRSIPMEQWSSLPSRVEAQTDDVLDLLERHSASATFFVLGCVADRTPDVVRRIARAGHEIGCHSYAHQVIYELTPAQFRSDTLRAIAAIEDAGGIRPRLYRAPSYSITARSLWALDILAECGFELDSSIVPVNHDRYGVPGFNRHGQTVETAFGPILEIPVATVQVPNGRVVPVGGGAYLRLLPYRYMAAGIRRVNESEGRPVCIYFHPWEIDPDQPRLASGLISRMRTYSGLGGMKKKLNRLLTEFQFSTMTAVYGNAAAKASYSYGGGRRQKQRVMELADGSRPLRIV
jgi:polysaccharide deacetylase family protein (PEP-CTERM system associated)